MQNRSKEKGEFLERLTAFLYEISGNKVQTNVRLPSTDGTNRKREIDVVLNLSTDEMGNCPVRVPIECKNYGKVIGVEQIDAFVGKLVDIGIPTSMGIYIAASGYTSGALQRAKTAGIQTLIANGLSKDRLELEIKYLLQSIVFWVPEWISTSTFSFLPKHASFPNAIQAKISPDANWEIGAIDVAWKLWISEAVPIRIGEHIIFIEKSDTEKAICTIQVTAHQINLIGEHSFAKFVEPTTEKPIKSYSKSKIRIPENTSQLNNIESEELIAEMANKVDLTVNIRVPRIRSMHAYWPLSEKTRKSIIKYRKSGEKPSFEKLEDTNILNAWTPT